MAVSGRVLAEIVPVPFFCGPEALQWKQLRDGILSKPLLLPGKFGFDYSPVRRVGVIDAGAVARARIVSLSVQGQGVDACKEQSYELPQRDPRRVIDHLDRLSVTGGIGIDLFVGGLIQNPARIAGHCGNNTVHALEKMLGAPEATACKIDSSVVHIIPVTEKAATAILI